jgi:hypothetical protein
MKRVVVAFTVVLLVVLTAVFAPEVAGRRTRVAPPDSIPNPAHFVAGDVARLASTGRPQLVEVFHYG